MAQWEAFLKKCSYSGRRKARPSGSDLPTAPQPPPPSAYASFEAGRPLPSLLPSFPLSEGRGSRKTSPSLALVGSPLPPPAVWWERRGERFLASGGEFDSAASSLSGVGVARPSHSQESSVLARYAPPSVERDP